MAKTVVGMFKTTTEAQRAKEEMVADGYESRTISVMSNEEYTEGTVHTGYDQGYGITGESIAGKGAASGAVTGSGMDATDRRRTTGGEGIGEKISHFFKSLTGGEDSNEDRGHEYYQQGVTQGGALLVATVDDDEADDVAQMLRDCGARNVDEENVSGSTVATTQGSTPRESYGEGTGYDSPGSGRERGTSEERTIPVVEEELQVGKRMVNRGGVRIYTHTSERPVDQDVTLREEHVRVERRPANRAATDADFNQKDGSIELRETAEEAVVGKTSRVVEEVVIGKEASQRTESIHDTVRKTEVEVERLEGEGSYPGQKR